MLDEKLSCLLDESEDEYATTKDSAYKNDEHYSDEKNEIKGKYQNNPSSILNFNIRNLGNLDNFFKNSIENKNIKQSKNKIKNNNINDNTVFYNVIPRSYENNSDSILKTNNKYDNEKNIMNTELKEKHAQLRVNAKDKSLNIKNVKDIKISKYSDDTLTYVTPSKEILENNSEKQSNDDKNLFNSLNNFHNDKRNSICKLNKSFNELESRKKHEILQKKSSFFKEQNFTETIKEEKGSNINYEQNNLLETNLYKEHFKINETEEDNTQSGKIMDNNIIKNDHKSSDHIYSYVSDHTSILIDTNNENNSYKKNNEIVEDNLFNYSNFNLKELPIVNKKSYSQFDSSEYIPIDKNKKSIVILNSNSTKSNSLLGPAGLRHKIKKHSNKKSKELIFFFSFIKYQSWLKALQIMNLPLDPFHLSINSHKYVYNSSSNDSFLYKYNIHNILNNKEFCNYRIERMMVIVKNIISRNHGYFLVVMDPSGQMPATLHKEVEKEYKKYINGGCTMLLKDVTVFDTIDNFPYLIITLRSLVRVIKAEETDYDSKERIFNQLCL